MSITRIQNNQITDSTIVGYSKLQAGSLTGNLFAPTVTLNSNVTITGNLFLSNTGNTTTINATNTYVNDPLVVFNNGYSGSLTGYDIGILVNRNLTSLAPYGSVNTAWVWVENDQAFESLATTDTGTGSTSINNSGYANIKVGNSTMVSATVNGALSATGAASLNTVTAASLQASAIGNVTAGTGAFTTLGASGIVTITNTTVNTGSGTGALQVSGGAYVAGNLYVGGNINANVGGQSSTFYGNAGGQGALFAGIRSGYLFEPLATIQSTANVNQYAGVFNGQNISSGAQASTDIFLSPDNGTYNDTYLDLGIGSSTYNYAGYSLIKPNDAYLFNWGNATTGGGNLILGTGYVNDIVFAVQGINTNNEVMRITNANVVAVKSTVASTSTTTGAMTIAGGLGVAGATYIGGVLNASGAVTHSSTTNLVGATTFTTATGGGLQAVAIGNVTPGTGAFTTVTGGSFQGIIGNVTPAAGTFTTVTANTETVGGLQAVAIGNVTPGTGAFTTATTGGLQAVAIGNVTPGTGAFTTVTGGSFQGIIGNVTPAAGTFTSVTANTETVGGLQAVAIGNVTPGTAVFTTATTGGLQAVAIGNVTAGTGAFTTLSASGVTQVTNATQSTSSSTGALQVTGGVGIGANLYVGGNTTIAGNLQVNGTLTYLNTTTTTVTGSEVVAGTLTANSGTASTSTTTGALQVLGGAGITGAINAGANISIGGTVPALVTAPGSNKDLTIDPDGAGNVYLSANTFIQYATPSTSTTTGALVVSGGAGITGNVYVGGGLQAVAIGNVTSGTGSFTTLTATTVNAATIGNVNANVVGTGTYLTALNGANVNGNVATANVAYYDNVVASSTNATYYVEFVNATSGNVATYTNSSLNFNPSTGNLAATAFVGSGAYLTNLNPGSISTVSTANAAIYVGVTNNTSGGTYYPMMSVQSTTGNTLTQVNGSLSYVPNTGTLSATAFNGSGTSTIQTLQVNGQLSASGAIIAGSGVATTNNSTGALQVTGGTAITGNINIGGQLFVGSGSQATSLTNAIAVKRGTSTSGPGVQYTQDALINATNTGSSDFIAYANNYPGPSNDHGWIDVGFTGDAFSDPVYSITKANDGYMFASGANATVGGNLVLATDYTGSNNDIVLGVGSFYSNSEVARFHGNTSNNGTFVIKLPTNASPAANTGALQVWGGASFGSNVYLGGAVYLNGSQAAGNDVVVKGKNDSTLIWARPNATYDTVIVGNSATSSQVVNGAKLNINTTDSILLPVGTSAQRPGSVGFTDTTGMFRYNSTINAIEFYNGTTWQGVTSSFTVIADQQFSGTGSQTAFTLSSSQTTASCIVSINGVLQIPTLAYSVSGTTLTFTEAPVSGDVIDVRMLTTTQTVTNVTSTNGYNSFYVDNNGAYISSGTAAQTLQYTIEPYAGALVVNGANVTIASAGTSVIDNLFANSYSSAKYTITATLQGTTIREVTEVLMVHTGNGAGAGSVYMSSYGRVNTAGNTLVTYSGATSGNIAQLQATTTNANTILRIKRDYMAI
jgi:hypothetical protein